MLTKTKDSFNVDALAQTLAAAAIESRAWAEDNWAKVRAERERLRTELAHLGLPTLPSETNFVLASVPSGAAEALYQALKARDVHVRWFSEPRLADRLRISIGAPDENDRLLDALAGLLPPTGSGP